MDSIFFMFIVCEGIGHLNPLLGLANRLVKLGHKVTILTSSGYRSLVEKNGCSHISYPLEKSDEATHFTKWINGSNIKSRSFMQPNIENVGKDMHFFNLLLSDVISQHDYLTNLINQLKPNIILVEHLIIVPEIELSGIPYVNFISHNPLTLYPEELVPPACSGCPTYDSSNWREYREKFKANLKPILDKINSWVESFGIKLPSYYLKNNSPYLNIYMFPEELDYSDIFQLPAHFMRVDSPLRVHDNDVDIDIICKDIENQKNANLNIPDDFLNPNKTLIYLSLGSIGSSAVDLMKNLIYILKDVPYNIIISLGPTEEYKLYDNMWGGKYLNQLKLLALVDLVITHGGNNTVNETLYFGKPIIAIPLFAEQADNAQRLAEKNLGTRINPYDDNFREKLLNSIEKLLNDKELHERLNKVKERIRSSKSIDNAIDAMIKIARKAN